ncbi:hypothetical protein [Nesterenkonia pannonica]|uniref:SURF1 family cytochrome oxidase biogenesis protein n=1 Tax=Nesterenkonia pannonica TaxID=1548602 RepID=UPI002164BC20|nr:SURF1 family cytochrome oxidase biogenesis protein [Nesterenkonia pannonica]
MLHTALQPKWIGTLILALLLATVFVVMSAWQFGESRSEDEIVSTEELNTPVALTEVYEPQRSMTIYEADRIVTLDGEIVPDTQALIASRIQGEQEGYWAVAAMRVDGAPDGEVIPLVLGWTDDPSGPRRPTSLRRGRASQS